VIQVFHLFLLQMIKHVCDLILFLVREAVFMLILVLESYTFKGRSDFVS